MKKEKNGKAIIYKCGKKWEELEKAKLAKNKKKAVKASESTEEVDNG